MGIKSHRSKVFGWDKVYELVIANISANLFSFLLTAYCDVGSDDNVSVNQKFKYSSKNFIFTPERYVGVFNNLPKTAYIKMIDIWFIFCMVIPFVEVILQTYIETLRARAGESISVNHHGRAINLQNTQVNNAGSL